MSAKKYMIVRKVLKGFGIVIAAAVFAMAGLSAFFFIAGRDIDPPDVSDILPSLPQVEPSENMVPVLMDATNLFVVTSPDRALAYFYRKDEWNHKLNVDGANRVLSAEEAAALVDQLLATNAALFAALDIAAARPHARYPDRLIMQYPIPELYDTDAYSALWSFEDTAYQYGVLVALRARRRRECGHSEEAVEEMLRLGEMFSRLSYENDTGLLLFLRGPDLPVAEELVVSAVKDDLSDETCVQIDAALEKWAKMRRESMRRADLVYFGRWHNFLSLDRAELYERLFPSERFEPAPQLSECRWICMLAKCAEWIVKNYPGYGRYAFQPNRTMQEFASEVRADCPQAYSTPYSPEVRARFAARAERMKKAESAHEFQRNSIGLGCINRGYGSGGAFRLVGRVAFADEVKRLAVAIARYRRKHGEAPARLEDLVPEFLDEVPRDPFDSTRPIGYNAEQGTIHTVGANGDFSGRIPRPGARYGGIRGGYYRYIYRIDGSSL